MGLAPALARTWRIARVGLGFAYYGLGALVLSAAVLPLQRALRPGMDEIDAQRTVHRASAGFIHVLEALGVARVRWEGAERLRERPQLVVANHPSLIDTPLLTSQMPQADFVVSPAWSENRYLRRAAAQAGYLRAEGGPRLVRHAAERLRAGRSLVIFPEGSRTPREGLRRFQRGAAHIALEAGCDLRPVWIEVNPRTLMKGQHWMDVPDAVPVWHVRVGDPIRPAEHLDGSESRPVAARRLTAVLLDWFEKRWGAYAAGEVPADRASGRRWSAR